ncbi:beta strand repeat-containing protein, partial [Polaribacter sp.]|uniref:beta strand repeat-containing protein n=1 Tax=Polaribacter sp. TaxID=1920175 RepID=UPI0040478506
MKKILLLCVFFASSIAFSQVTFITTDTNWSGDVNIDGKVVVNNNATLTIQPGTVIKAVFKSDPVDASALVVAKGAKIIANGTAALPIIFTAAADPLTAANVAAGVYVAPGHDLDLNGLWGGVIILGNNVIGAGANNTANIEGIAAGQTWTNYGGTLTDDNSGSLKYISIRHGGATIANGSEINGLTLGGVGNKTVVENIEIISNDDDGIEIFGGNVNVNNLLIYNQTDDAIDLDQAYSGTITNALVAMGVGSDTVFEIDGTESTSTPRVTGSYTIDGVTAIGNANATRLTTYGDWKADPMGVNKNIVFKGFKVGSKIKGIDLDTYGTTLTFSNLDFVTTDVLSAINATPTTNSTTGAVTNYGQLTSTHAEILSAQASGTGANTCVFSGWTAYFTKDTNLCSSSNIGNGTVFFITTDTNWSGTVNIDGKVVVNNNATLTIQPGTVIKAAFKSDPVDASALVVAKGSKLIANGTAALPIIFTAAADPLTAADVASGVYVAAGHDLDLNGLWGGVIILGNNVIGAGANNTANIEGIAAGQTWTNYGGTLTDDNSGSLKYVSIRHGGATIANGSEINGLTLGGVGNKTTVENIEIISNDDDGIEIFGGNVNVNNLLIYNQTDDAIDLDQAYSGTITNAYVAMGVGSDTVFEIDGTESTSTPRVTGSYTIDGVTAIGNANATRLTTYGDWKADPMGVNKNIVFKGFKVGSKIKGIDLDTYGTTLTFSNLDFVTTDVLSAINATPTTNSTTGAVTNYGQLTSTHAEILSAQA